MSRFHTIWTLVILILVIVAIPIAVYSQGQVNITPSSTTQPYNVTVRDCSITLNNNNLPQLLVNVNAGRKFISFQTVGHPTGNASIPSVGYSYTTNVPAIGNSGTFTLYPGATGGHESSTVPTNAVYVIGPPGTIITCNQG